MSHSFKKKCLSHNACYAASNLSFSPKKETFAPVSLRPPLLQALCIFIGDIVEAFACGHCLSLGCDSFRSNLQTYKVPQILVFGSKSIHTRWKAIGGKSMNICSNEKCSRTSRVRQDHTLLKCSLSLYCWLSVSWIPLECQWLKKTVLGEWVQIFTKKTVAGLKKSKLITKVEENSWKPVQSHL